MYFIPFSAFPSPRIFVGGYTMPVYLKKRIKKGWKKDENKRVGPCMVWVFCDEKTDKELFHYAPNLVDEPFFTCGFEDLKLLDELNKSYSKAKSVLSNIEDEIKVFEKGMNTTQTTKSWNDTCRLKNE